MFSIQPQLQLMLPIPLNTSYKLVAHYMNQRLSSSPVYGTVMQSSASYDIYFPFEGSHTCTQNCYTEAIVVNGPANNTLNLLGNHAATIILRLDGTNILLVSDNCLQGL